MMRIVEKGLKNILSNTSLQNCVPTAYFLKEYNVISKPQHFILFMLICNVTILNSTLALYNTPYYKTVLYALIDT